MGILDGYMPDLSAPYYTQDYVPIKNIFGGVIQTKDERLIKIVEVLPVNFDSKSWQEKDDIIAEFKGWLTVSPINVQIKIVTEETDPNKIIKKINERIKSDKDIDVETHAKHYTNLLKRLGSNGTVSRRFYLIISYETKATSKKNPTIEDMIQELEESATEISQYFDRMGNIIVPLSESGKPEDEQVALMELLYKFYNPRTCKDEPNKPAITLQERMDRVSKDKIKINDDPKATIGIEDVIAPMNIDVNDKGCVMYDGLYHSYLLVAGDSYPIQTWAGWFPSLFAFSPGETVDIFLHKEPRAQFVKKISTAFRLTQVKLSEKHKTQSDYEKTEMALDSADYIKETINRSNEDPFFITTLITLTAYTKDDLMRRKEQVIEFFETKNFVLYPLNNIQEESMRSSFPFLDLSPKLYEKGKRNILSSGLASCYPFISSTMNDDDGVLMGISKSDNTMCVFNPYNTKNYSSANMIILGSTGMGKTYLGQTMAMRLRATGGVQCFIIAPYKGHEFQRACSIGMGGEFIEISSASKSCINIMDVYPKTSEAMEILLGESAGNTSWVSEQAAAITTFISLLTRDLSNEDEQLLDTCIMRTYEKYGINEQNDSVYKDPQNKDKGLKKMPIIQDLYAELESANADKRLLSALTRFITGSAKAFNQRTNVNLDSKYVVFDISQLEDRLIPAGMFLILNSIVNRIQNDLTKQKLVYIDECWRLIGGGASVKAAEYVKWFVKINRAYNCGTCLATQDIGDFFALNDGEYGKAILANSQIKFLLGLRGKDLELVQNEVSLTSTERRNLERYQRGDCLICAGANHVSAYIKASQYEHKLITTDPQEVKKVIAEMKANGGKLM